MTPAPAHLSPSWGEQFSLALGVFGLIGLIGAALANRRD